MVDSILASGLNAYKATQKLGSGIGDIGSMEAGGAASATGGGSFGDMLSSAIQDNIGTLKKGEAAMVGGAKGTADITDVVGSVQSAMQTLETVTAVRDKVISAYQDVLRMPI